MRLVSVRLKNFCQFTDSKFYFQPGFTGIFGKNGSGKSNLLNGIFGCLTGYFKTDGVLTDNINKLAKSTDQSFVELNFTHNNHNFYIKRSLKPSKVILKCDGNLITDKFSDFNSHIFKIFGFDPKVFYDHVFIAQNSIFDFFNKSQSDRISSLNRLFGLEFIVNIGNSIKDIWIDVPDIIERKNILDQIEENNTNIQKISSELFNYAHIDDELDIKELNYKIDKYNFYLNSLETIKSNNKKILKIKETIKKIKEEVTAKKIYLASVFLQLKKLKPFYEEAKEILEEWKIYTAKKATIDDLNVKFNKIQSDLKFICEEEQPTKPDDYVAESDSEFYKTLEDKKQSLRFYKTFLDTFFSSEVKTCPVCLTKVENISLKYEEAKLSYDNLVSEIKEMENRNKKSRQYDDLFSVYMNKKSLLESTKQKINESIISFSSDLKEPSKPKDQVSRIVNEWKRLNEEKDKFINLIKGQSFQIKNLELSIREIQEENKKLDSCVPVELTEDKLMTFKNSTTNIINKWYEKNKLKNSLNIYKEREKFLITKLNEIDEFNRKRENKIKINEFLSNIKKIFHPDGLPKIAASAYLKIIESKMNDFLKSFSSDFLVSIDDSWEIKAIFNNGNCQPASRLSGGQKVVLSLAFRVVANSIFANNIGLLCLDEPTAGLDENNMFCISHAINVLKEASLNNNIQVIIVTHEKSLNSLFENTIFLN